MILIVPRKPSTIFLELISDHPTCSCLEHRQSLGVVRSARMFNLLRSLFRPKPAITDPYEQFVVAFIEECGRQGLKPISYDHESRSFVFGDAKGGNHTVYLENNFRIWSQRDAQA